MAVRSATMSLAVTYEIAKQRHPEQVAYIRASWRRSGNKLKPAKFSEFVWCYRCDYTYEDNPRSPEFDGFDPGRSVAEQHTKFENLLRVSLIAKRMKPYFVMYSPYVFVGAYGRGYCGRRQGTCPVEIRHWALDHLFVPIERCEEVEALRAVIDSEAGRPFEAVVD